MVKWLTQSTHINRQQCSNTLAGQGPCVELECSPHVSVGFPWILWLPPTFQRQVRLIVESKFPVGVNGIAIALV